MKFIKYFCLWFTKLIQNFRIAASAKCPKFFKNFLTKTIRKIFIIFNLIKFVPKPFLETIQIRIVEHCNLNCAYCDHFCPLISKNEKVLEVEIFKKDMSRIKELIGENVLGDITLLGGEPLLHNEIVEFMKISNKLFPKTPIKIITNGILLPNMDDNFWQTAKETSTKIYVTNYPIKLNKEIIKEKSEFYHVEVFFSDELKTMWITPLNIKKNSNRTIQFLNCQHSKCSMLYRGKIYKCPRIQTIKYFNKYFDLNFEVTEKDYIDIYNVKSIEQILKNLARPVPFCKNCDTFNISYGHQWKISDKKIEEWVCKKI